MNCPYCNNPRDQIVFDCVCYHCPGEPTFMEWSEENYQQYSASFIKDLFFVVQFFKEIKSSSKDPYLAHFAPNTGSLHLTVYNENYNLYLKNLTPSKLFQIINRINNLKPFL